MKKPLPLKDLSSLEALADRLEGRMKTYDNIETGVKVEITLPPGVASVRQVVTAKEPRWGRPVAPMYWTSSEGPRITPDNFVRIVEP